MEHFNFVNSPPVIICGNPRSGTRMCANVMSSHPDVLITGEWHNVSKLKRMVNRFGEYLPEQLPDDERRKRVDVLARTMWALRDPGANMDKLAQAAYVGNKTPTVEHHFERFEALFSSKPIYIYCVRNAFSVLRSVKNLENLAWHKNSVEKNLSLYLSSLNKYQEMCRQAPGRVYLVKLDELKQFGSNVDYYRFLFDALGLSLDAAVEKRINKLGKQNSMERVRAKINVKDTSVVELTDEEVHLIQSSSDYRRLVEELDIPDSNLT